VWWTGRWVHPLGELGTDVGALVEPLAVGYHAVRLSALPKGGTAVVFGAGPIGLVTIASLKATGAGQIIAVEPAAARKGKAPGAGADVVLDPTETDVPAAVRELTEGAGADVAFECAGIDAVLASAIASVRPGGLVVNVAIWGQPATVQMNSLVMSEVSLLGLVGLPRRPPGHHPAAHRRHGRRGPSSSPPEIGLDELVEGGFRQLSSTRTSTSRSSSTRRPRAEVSMTAPRVGLVDRTRIRIT